MAGVKPFTVLVIISLFGWWLVIAASFVQITQNDKKALTCDHPADSYVRWAENEFTPTMFITSNQVRKGIIRLVGALYNISDRAGILSLSSSY